MPTKQKREGKLSPYRDIVLQWLTDDKIASGNQAHHKGDCHLSKAAQLGGNYRNI